MDNFIKTNFMQCVIDFYIRRIFDIKGRSSRCEFWYPFLFNIALFFLTSIIAVIPVVGSIAFVFVYVLFTWGTLAMITLNIRMLHDHNHSGWHILWYIFPITTFLFSLYALYMYIVRGDIGDNRYGPDPVVSREFYRSFKGGFYQYQGSEYKKYTENQFNPKGTDVFRQEYNEYAKNQELKRQSSETNGNRKF